MPFISTQNVVKNPFKQQRNVWIHYSGLIAIALGLTVTVIYCQMAFPSSSVVQSEKGGNIATGNDNGGFNQNRPVINASNKFGDRVNPSGRQPKPFHAVADNDFDLWLHTYYQDLEWSLFPSENVPVRLNRDILSESLRLGCTNIAENQQPAGNFNYEYDFVNQKLDRSDSAVRQAGALWGISLCYQYWPENTQFQNAVEKGIRFFMDHSIQVPTTSSKGTMLVVQYPDHSARDSSTGTNALFGLAMIEYLRTIDNVRNSHINIIVNDEFVDTVHTSLDRVLRFLQSMQRPNKHFADAFYLETSTSNEQQSQHSSPYFDGETMLCLIKAAKYIRGFAGHLIPLLEETAPVLAKAYSIDAWIQDADSDLTKGFYQWSSMVFTEYYQAGWSNADLYGDYVMVLAHWILHTHNVLNRRRNTGYAFEGIISAYEIARSRGHEAAIKNLELAIDHGLYKLSTWQVGGPLSNENEFLVKHPTSEKIAIGGIMNSRNQAPLRIDTTQHQMHAIIMALNTVYKN